MRPIFDLIRLPHWECYTATITINANYYCIVAAAAIVLLGFRANPFNLKNQGWKIVTEETDEKLFFISHFKYMTHLILISNWGRNYSHFIDEEQRS